MKKNLNAIINIRKEFCFLLLALLLSTISVFPLKAAESHNMHSNHIALFTGVTSNFAHQITDFSLGMDYEFRLPILKHLLGIGVFGEVVFSNHKEYLVGIPIFIHATDGFKFIIAPGYAFAETVIDTSNHTNKISKKEITLSGSTESEIEKHFLLRLGVGYDFHIRSFSITPTLNFDIIQGKASMVYGIAFGLGF